MKKIGPIIRKEFLQLKRDPRLLPILFISPVMQLLLLGYAVNLDVKDIPTLVCDLDGTAASRNFVAEFLNSGYFRLRDRVSDIRDVDLFLDNGRASVAIVVERGFADHLAGQRQAGVQLLVDGTESQSATIGANYANAITARYGQDIVKPMLDKLRDLGVYPVSVNPEVRVWYNPELRSRNFMVPGVLGLVLMIMTMMLTAMAIVREKEIGTMEQLIVTPIRPVELIVGKLLPFVMIGIMDAALVVSIATLWFRIPLRGSVPLLFFLSLIFMMTTLGLGLFTSTISRSQQQAMMTTVFFMMPMMLLSGFVFPIENMPKIFQWITLLVPLRYYFVIVRGIFLKGVGLGALWDEMVALVIFGLAILSLSVLRFRKKLG